jgi:hypothetical protein
MTGATDQIAAEVRLGGRGDPDRGVLQSEEVGVAGDEMIGGDAATAR